MTLLTEIHLHRDRSYVTATNDRKALGYGTPGALPYCCHFCSPALVEAFLYVDGRPCCHKCAGDPNRHSSMPKILWRDA